MLPHYSPLTKRSVGRELYHKGRALQQQETAGGSAAKFSRAVVHDWMCSLVGPCVGAFWVLGAGIFVEFRQISGC